jgi:hypothetical protein
MPISELKEASDVSSRMESILNELFGSTLLEFVPIASLDERYG